MNGREGHIIQKVILEISGNMQSREVRELQVAAGELAHSQLPGLLESLFDNMPAGRYIVIDQLEVSLGTLDTNRFVEQFVKRLRVEIRKKIRNYSAGAGAKHTVKQLNERGHHREILHYYLQTGLLPWFAIRRFQPTGAKRIPGRGDSTGYMSRFRELLINDLSYLGQLIGRKSDSSQYLERLLKLLEPVPADLFRNNARSKPDSGRRDHSEFQGSSAERTSFVRSLELLFQQTESRVDKPSQIPSRFSSKSMQDLMNRFKGDKKGFLSHFMPGREHQVFAFEHEANDLTGWEHENEIEKALLHSVILASGTTGFKDFVMLFFLRLHLLFPKVSSALATASRLEIDQSDPSKKHLTLSKNELNQIFDTFSAMRGRMESPADRQKGRPGKPTRINLPDAQNEPETSGIRGEGVNISLAGLVLLWPYLERFFSNLELIYEGDFLDMAARQKAMQLLGFLATGEEQLPEYRMPFIKLLCGYPVEEIPGRPPGLSQTDIRESITLLNSVISHWSALKSTSVDGLRESFLQREGVLRKERDGWNLYVEKESFDILLEKIPWSYSVVRLPWMNKPVLVKW
jgi:hypothetical protein